MYFITFFVALGRAFFRMTEKAEQYHAETGTDMLDSVKYTEFAKSFFLTLLVLWTIETLLYGLYFWWILSQTYESSAAVVTLLGVRAS